MFDWVLNRPMVLTNRQLFSLSNFEKFKVQKKFIYLRVEYELTDNYKGGKDAFGGFIFLLVAVRAIIVLTL